jgi:FkbM family methyltransferase
MGLEEGATVTYVAMQLAYYMGFSEVVLIGVDHHFVTQGTPHKTVVSEGDDPNHFDPSYFGQGLKWQLPDLEGSEKSYRVAKQVFEESGRKIIDATVNGRCQVFPKQDYRVVFKESLSKTSGIVDHSSVENQSKLGHDLYELGEQKTQEGKPTEAISYYRQAIDINPNEYIFYHRLGNILHYSLKNIEEGITAYNKALKLNPRYSWSYYHLGIALEMKGNIKKAIDSYEKALQFDKNFKKASQRLEQAKTQLHNSPDPFYINLMRDLSNASCKFEELDLLVGFPYQDNTPPILVDVGAHTGYVSGKFAEKGWRIIAFEPEPENRSALQKHLKAYHDTTIIPKAVSNQANQSVTFYVSSEHWGIHSLKPFHKTHQPKLTVETVRLDTTLEKLGINDVTLLKVDTEGADFLVLQSFDFTKIQPEIVMCEFADDRSVPNFGCSHHDIARYMQDYGYHVFLSEWAPIIEYGRKGKKSAPHYFLQCTRYPVNHSPAWGNLIFVRDDRLKDFEKTLKSYFNPRYQKREQIILESSNQRIATFAKKHEGERCVIVGNGPSLNQMDLSFLKKEITFGLNKMYLGFEKKDFLPTYYVAVNQLIIEQSANEICKIPSIKFISNKGIPYITPQKELLFVNTDQPTQDFSSNPTQGLNEGSTATYVALQLAYYMGFKTVILIGLDNYFVAEDALHQEVLSQGNEPNHFHPNYLGKGTKWQLPNIETVERLYKTALAKFWLDSRTIIDATVDGRCPVFMKKSYKELFF